MWLSLLTSKWTWITLMLLGLCGTIGVQRLTLQHRAAEITELEQTIGKMKADVAERDALIETQNRAVEGWKAAGIENAKRAALAESKARALAESSARIPLPVAPKSNPSCAERDSWLRSEMNSLLWR